MLSNATAAYLCRCGAVGWSQRQRVIIALILSKYVVDALAPTQLASSRVHMQLRLETVAIRTLRVLEPE